MVKMTDETQEIQETGLTDDELEVKFEGGIVRVRPVTVQEYMQNSQVPSRMLRYCRQKTEDTDNRKAMANFTLDALLELQRFYQCVDHVIECDWGTNPEEIWFNAGLGNDSLGIPDFWRLDLRQSTIELNRLSASDIKN